MKIPLRISFTFFLTAGLIGFLSTGTLIGTLIWIGIIFVSILVHEYGHALASYYFGQQPRIELVAFGGLTIPSGPRLKLWKEFIVVFCGPLFGFCLYIIAQLLLNAQLTENLLVINILRVFSIINLFWTIVNLLPVIPLDGGQLLRIIMEGIFGIKGVRYALAVGMILSLTLGLLTIAYGAIILAILFFLFAFQNFEMFRQTRNISQHDNDDDLKLELAKAEKLFVMGEKEEAGRLFTHLRNESKEGILYMCATEYLSQIAMEKRDFQEAYNLLLSIEDNLSDEGKCLLNNVAFEVQDYERVAKLSGFCYQTYPSFDVALHAAKACALMGDLKSTIGWLKSSLTYETESLQEIIKDASFDNLRDDPEFLKFTQD
ncbi:MAG: site-2 protease family protein [Simkaniaceae bacterium]|nr:site-2 protease family protein [Simkaniaceae bacterium]